MIKVFFKSAFRNILRQKLYTIINVFDLAVGMACFVLISLWVSSELNYDRCFENSDHIYLIHKGTGNSMNPYLAFPLATVVHDEVPEVNAISRVDYHPSLVRFGDIHFNEQGLVAVDSSYFSIFSYDFIHGTAETVLRNPNEIVITESKAKAYFGNDHPIHKILILDGNKQYVVTGVIKDPPLNTHLDHDMFIPIEPLYRNTEIYNDWYDHFLFCYVYASPTVPVEILNKKISEILDKNTEDEESGVSGQPNLRLFPVSKLHLYNVEGKNQGIQYVYIFSLIAILVLIVACINYMNIATSVSIKRSREIGLRKVVGALRYHLSLQFLAEAFIQAFFAMLLSMMLVELVRPLFNQLSGKNIIIPYTSIWFIPMLLGMVVLITFLAGSYPAFLMSSFKPISAFKGKLVSGKGLSQFRKILVIFQFFISISLIISTLFIYLQLSFINNKDLGFQKDDIMYEFLNDDIGKKYDLFRNDLLKNPNVLNVCRTSQLPNNISYGMRGIEWFGRQESDVSHFNFASVDYDFFETTGIEFVDGRAFSRDFGMDSSHYIMNESSIKLIGYEAPVGRQFSTDDEKGRIIGVVKDFHSKPLTMGIGPTFFIMVPEYYNYVMIKIRPENTEETIKYIEGVWNKIAPLYTFESRFFNSRIDRTYRIESRNGKLALAFTIIIIIISCMGLFGLASHTTQSKTKEIGIRKVFGASVNAMMLKFIKIFSIWMLIANIAAWPIAYFFIDNWLNNFAYRVDLHWWVFIVSGIITLLIALFTTGFHVSKASRNNPIDSLKYE